MIINHIKIAWRNLLKNKGYAAINITGLAVGIAAVLLIAFWVQNQFQYDNFYKDQENIHKLWTKNSNEGKESVHDITSAPAGESLKAAYPEVLLTARMYWSSEDLFSYADKDLKSKGNQVDPDFIQLFGFELISGNSEQALNSPYNIVITESLAKNLFGAENPINKHIIMNNDKPYLVTGVLKDLPSYTDFDFSYLIPLTAQTIANSGSNWNTNTYYTFIKVADNTDLELFNQKIAPFLSSKATDLKHSSIFLYPMAKMHLYSTCENGVPVAGKINQVRMIAGLGLLILLIACINFMNLATARSQKRSKEVGVRKVVGARKSSLIQQFLIESSLLALLAGMLAMLLLLAFLPVFNSILDQPIQINWSEPSLWLCALAFVLLTGLMAGIYPAFVLSALNPLKNLKGNKGGFRFPISLRECLVILQFGIAVLLIVASLVIRLQIQHAGERETGYQVAHLIEIPAEGDIDKNYGVLKSELLQSGLAEQVTRTGWTITRNASTAGGSFAWEGASPEQVKNSSFELIRAESDFVSTLGLTLVEGRDFDLARMPADSAMVLLNETAIQSMGLENPVGKNLKWGDTNYTIAGVLQDHISGDPYSDIKPLLIYPSKNYLYNIVVRTNPTKPLKDNLAGIEKTLKIINPNYPFTFNFVDQRYAEKFKDQEQMARLTMLFSLLAIFISCLGLFGLASYIAETRIKEIGIRKVLGASVLSIASMLSKDFIKLVLIGILIAAPIAWWLLSNWLNNFTYRIEFQWWMLVFSGTIAIGIAMATVSYKAIRAALANPVQSLRDD